MSTFATLLSGSISVSTYRSSVAGAPSLAAGPEPAPEVDCIPYLNSVPLYGLSAAAGDFSPPQIVEDYEWIPTPPHVKVSQDLFACKVVGESMNKVIPNGSVCLFRKYSGGSRNGKIVLVELSHLQDPDSGSHYTVKEYESVKSYARRVNGRMT